MKLKSRQEFPPPPKGQKGGFQFVQPETGWTAPEWRSFDAVVRELIAHRRGNIAMVKKHNWSLDYNTVADEVDHYNAVRCLNAGYLNYITDERTLAVIPKTLRPRVLAPLTSEAVVGAVKRTKAGIGLLIDWLGQGAKPVTPDQANARAAVCVQCPLNQEGNFWQRLEAKSAEALKKTMEIKKDMDLSTPWDDQLHSCQACDCWNPLKVWVQASMIKKHMDVETRSRLHPSCWIFKEGL